MVLSNAEQSPASVGVGADHAVGPRFGNCANVLRRRKFGRRRRWRDRDSVRNLYDHRIRERDCGVEHAHPQYEADFDRAVTARPR